MNLRPPADSCLVLIDDNKVLGFGWPLSQHICVSGCPPKFHINLTMLKAPLCCQRGGECMNPRPPPADDACLSLSDDDNRV